MENVSLKVGTAAGRITLSVVDDQEQVLIRSLVLVVGSEVERTVPKLTLQAPAEQQEQLVDVMNELQTTLVADLAPRLSHAIDTELTDVRTQAHEWLNSMVVAVSTNPLIAELIGSLVNRGLASDRARVQFDAETRRLVLSDVIGEDDLPDRWAGKAQLSTDENGSTIVIDQDLEPLPIPRVHVHGIDASGTQLELHDDEHTVLGRINGAHVELNEAGQGLDGLQDTLAAYAGTSTMYLMRTLETRLSVAEIISTSEIHENLDPVLAAA